MVDFVVIGAGIVGSLIARGLSRYDADTVVLEKENDVANVQTAANSAIIHSGHNPKPGTLRARLCVRGNELYDDLKEELGIPLIRTGAFVVAHGSDGERQLKHIADTAKKNGVSEFALLGRDEILAREPRLSDRITAALSLPTTKVTTPWEVAFRAMEQAVDNGVSFKKNAEVTDVTATADGFSVRINDDDAIITKHVIDAAGIMADRIGAFLEEPPFTVTPRKGEYFVIDRKEKGFVNRVIYPLPTDKGKGVLLTPQVHGEILLGPSSDYIDERIHAKTTREGMAYVREQSKVLSDQIPYQSIIRSFAGIRSSIKADDFHIKASEAHPHFYYLGGIDSPGLTAAPAIAEHLLGEVMHIEAHYDKKASFEPYRKDKRMFRDMSEDEQKRLIAQDARYGNIVCRCEHITEREIVDAMHGPLGSATIKGIKKRTRAGAGRCQGGSCEEKIVRLIAREKEISPLDVNYDGEHSKLFKGYTKKVTS